MKLVASNLKLDKGLKFGYMSGGLSFAPAKLSGKNVCSHSTDECETLCIGETSGMNQTNTAKAAKVTRTLAFYDDKASFMSQLWRELKNFEKLSRKKGYKPVFRPNVYSDLWWSKILHNGESMMSAFPGIQMIDYTKVYKRMTSFLRGDEPDNYHVTFSNSGRNIAECKAVLAQGGNVATVFRGALPDEYLGHEVIDADVHDLRFLDPRPVIVGLVAKGAARKGTYDFVIGS